MRIIILAILILILLWVIISPIVRLRTSPSWFLVTILAGIILVTAGFEVKWQYTESQATQVVQKISEREEGVAKCQRLSEAFTDAQVSVIGWVAYAEDNKALIKYSQCQELSSFLLTDKTQATDEQLQAIGVVFHESYHVKGEFNEATTQCLTVKHYAENLKMLNVPTNYRESYAARYAENSLNMPPEYLNGVC